ncbi:hypothetical protein JG688_00018483 [Phytophthora aleatoria]|uniref:Uncharacterized protein n=1 Tax=Phytophthora aleatoria TaxID=2496075 RepID=A0A8J5LXN3_9STRA|nr:hypothetical protein JG688_00018483 [Phytophthora aleatoria]
MSRQTAEGKAPDSSEPRAPPLGNDLLFKELEEGQVDYEESVASVAHSHTPSARSHTSGVSSVRALRDAPPLTSRYEEDRRDPNVITNDLDVARSRQLYTEPSSQRSNRPVARLLVPFSGATMASNLWILRRPRAVLRCSSWTLTCVGHRPVSNQSTRRCISSRSSAKRACEAFAS